MYMLYILSGTLLIVLVHIYMIVIYLIFFSIQYVGKTFSFYASFAQYLIPFLFWTNSFALCLTLFVKIIPTFPSSRQNKKSFQTLNFFDFNKTTTKYILINLLLLLFFFFFYFLLFFFLFLYIFSFFLLITELFSLSFYFFLNFFLHKNNTHRFIWIKIKSKIPNWKTKTFLIFLLFWVNDKKK